MFFILCQHCVPYYFEDFGVLLEGQAVLNHMTKQLGPPIFIIGENTYNLVPSLLRTLVIEVEFGNFFH